MVSKKEIMRVTRLCGLKPQVIEKDYVLGWILAGIYQHASLKNSWIFKGGTSFRKCHFETCRFSEDLDFTIPEPSYLNHDFLIEVFREISDWLLDRCGLEIPKSLLSFEFYTNSRGSKSCQGKLGYRGPIGPLSGYRSLPRLKIDLTLDEIVVLPPIQRIIHHHYSDNPQEDAPARCYAPEEAFAEKICALGRRAISRDLYDVINIFRNNDIKLNRSVLNDLLQKKCEHRSRPIPTLTDVQAKRNNLETTWEHMLVHQLQELPPFESYFNALSKFFDWLKTGDLPSLPAIGETVAGEVILREPTMSLPINLNTQTFLETIRFCAVNHMCVDLQDKQSTHRIEPYSLHRSKDGDIVLHAIRDIDGEHCSYKTNQIHGATATQQSFIPRYSIELRPKL